MDLVHMFNQMYKRDFFSNCHYKRAGGDQVIIQSYLDNFNKEEADKLNAKNDNDEG